MSANKHRFEFNAETDMADVDAALLLALWGAQSLHGEIAVRTDARYFLEEESRICLIDVSTPVGHDLSRRSDRAAQKGGANHPRHHPPHQ